MGGVEGTREYGGNPMMLHTFGFPDASAVPASTGPECRTITDPASSGDVVIYPHGFSVRISIGLDKASTAQALARCGWHPAVDPKTWVTYTPRGGHRRWVLRGSAWLTQRAPRNPALPLATCNRAWKTRLYSIAVEEDGTSYALNLQGVRHLDVRRLVEEVLNIPAGQYHADYYGKAERYVVLHAVDAQKVAPSLGGGLQVAGRGRVARKRFLARDFHVPVVVRRRTQIDAVVNLYRIERGATASYKLEAAMSGKRRDRQQFVEADIERLDEILLRLVDAHGLTPVHKPSRWEPHQAGARVQRHFEPHLQRLPQAAWRGTAMPTALLDLAQKCHTPGRVVLLESRTGTAAYPAQPCIRSDTPSSSSSSSSSSLPASTTSKWTRTTGKGFDVTCWTRVTSATTSPTTTSSTMKPDSPWTAMAQELSVLKGYLAEVVLDGHQDPIQVVEALSRISGRKMGLSALCPVLGGKGETWQSVVEVMDDYPVSDDMDLWVVVVDVGVVQAILHGLDPVNLAKSVLPIEPDGMVNLATVASSGFSITEQDVVAAGGLVRVNQSGLVEVDFATVSAILKARPKMVPDWWDFRSWGLMPQVARSVAAWFWPMLAAMRAACESGGINIVLITTDLRPHRGRGSLEPSHHFTDTRLRSWLGDAGRYLTHMRYLVEHEEDRNWWHVAATKDEAEGRVGRVLFEGPILAAGSRAGPAASTCCLPVEPCLAAGEAPKTPGAASTSGTPRTQTVPVPQGACPKTVPSDQDSEQATGGWLNGWTPERQAALEAALEECLAE